MPHEDFHMPYSWRYFLHSELNQLYVSLAFRSFAFSMISLFVPAYLYSELGYSLTEVFSFYIYFSLAIAIFSPLFGIFAAKIGFKHLVVLSVPLQLAYFILLYLLESFQISLIIVGFVMGAGLAAFYLGNHLEFQEITHAKSRATEVGKGQIAQVIGLMLGPLIGGGLIHYVGFVWVFILVGIILASSSLFLFLSKEHKSKHEFSWDLFLKQYNFKLMLYYLYRGTWVIAGGVLWPLYIFLTTGSYLSLGVVGTLMALVTAFLTYLVGRKSDKIGKHKMLSYSVVPDSILWIFKGFAVTLGGIIGMSLGQSISGSIMQSPLLALEYDRAKKSGAEVEYVIWRQSFIAIGRILLLLFVMLTLNFFASFAVVGLGTFFVFFL